MLNWTFLFNKQEVYIKYNATPPTYFGLEMTQIKMEHRWPIGLENGNCCIILFINYFTTAWFEPKPSEICVYILE